MKKISITGYVLFFFACMLNAAEPDQPSAEMIREQLYAGTLTTAPSVFSKQEKRLLDNRDISTAVLKKLSIETIKQLVILKTAELEYLYSIEHLVSKLIQKDDREKQAMLKKIRTDNSFIISFIQKNKLTELYSAAADYSFAMIPIFKDAGKVHSMQASRFMRNILIQKKHDAAAQVHYGTYISYLISTQKHTDLPNLTGLALSLLSDSNIEALTNKIFQYRAYCYKSAVYMKNYNSKKAYDYYNRAKEIFPDTKLQHIGEIHYHTEAENNEPYRTTGFKANVSMPYYADAGLYYRNGDFALFSPYIGIGLNRTFFASAWFAETGLKLYYKHFKWKIEYKQAFTPDPAVKTIRLFEYYGTNTFTVQFPSLAVSAETKAGGMVFGKNPLHGHTIHTQAIRLFAVKQNIICNFSLYDNGFDHISGVLESGIYFIPSKEQSIGYMQAEIPATFHFGHSELGFLPHITYAHSLTKRKTLNAFPRHAMYRGGILLTKQHSIPEHLYYSLYELNGNLSGTYRIFFSPLKAPADRLYVGLNGNVGFGTDTQTRKTDLLYASGLSFGFQLYDLRPFEVRLQIDQDANIFFMMTVLNPVKHKK